MLASIQTHTILLGNMKVVVNEWSETCSQMRKINVAKSQDSTFIYKFNVIRFKCDMSKLCSKRIKNGFKTLKQKYLDAKVSSLILGRQFNEIDPKFCDTSKNLELVKHFGAQYRTSRYLMNGSLKLC